MAELRIVLEEATVLRPGDTLILRVGERATAKDLAELAEQVRGRLPNNDVLVLGGVEQVLVQRPEVDNG